MSKNPLYKKTLKFKEVNYLERRLFTRYIPRSLQPSGLSGEEPPFEVINSYFNTVIWEALVKALSC